MANNQLSFDLVPNANQYILYVNDEVSATYATSPIDVSAYLDTLELPIEFKVVASDSTGVYGNGNPGVLLYAGLEPGLYDANDNLVASWDELVNTYGMDCQTDYTSSTYKTNAASPYYVLTNTTELASDVKLVVDDGATIFGSYAFSHCESLANATIPFSTTKINSKAFGNDTSLVGINYSGAVADWSTITLNSSWNSNIGDYTIYCTDGTIAKDGTVTMN